MIAYRFADVPQKRPRSRFTADYNISDRLQVGFEYNFLVQELGFRGSWILQHENEQRPMVHLNTSSDRIGTPKGYEQVSLTIAKGIKGAPLAPYASVTYSGFEKKLVFPFGLNYQINSNWSLLGMHDGRKSHLMLNYSTRYTYVQIGWIWLKHPSITIGWGF